MIIDIGASVKTREGEEIGKVERVILDPNTREVEALVVHRGLILTRDVVVPLSLVQGADRSGVNLRIGRDQLRDLPDFVERHYVPRLSEGAVNYPYAPGSMLFPLAPPYAVAGPPVPYRQPDKETPTPPEGVDISQGTTVLTVNGPIGVVDELRTDALADRVSTIVVKKGMGLSKDAEIPIEFVEEVTDDQIRLSLTTQQVEELPQPTTDMYLTVEGRSRKRSRR